MTAHRLGIALVLGVALATAACSSSEPAGEQAPSAVSETTSDAGSAVDEAANGQEPPIGSSQELLLTAEEIPAGDGFQAMPQDAVEQVQGNMAIPPGVTIEPPECAESADVTTAFVTDGESAMIAGNGAGGTLMLADVVVKGGSPLSEIRDAHANCGQVRYSGDGVSYEGTTEVSDGPRIEGADETLSFTTTASTDAAGMNFTVNQYGVAGEVRGVRFLVSASSLDGSGELSPEAKQRVEGIAQAQAAKIDDAA